MDSLNDIISAILLITGGLIAVAAIPILLLAVVVWIVSGIAWVFRCDADELLNAIMGWAATLILIWLALDVHKRSDLVSAHLV